MAKLTEVEMLGHIEAVKKDAAKYYNCSEKDLLLKVLKSGAISVRLKNAAQRERQK